MTTAIPQCAVGDVLLTRDGDGWTAPNGWFFQLAEGESLLDGSPEWRCYSPDFLTLTCHPSLESCVKHMLLKTAAPLPNALPSDPTPTPAGLLPGDPAGSPLSRNRKESTRA